MDNNINILKFLCKKIQVRGNYLSIKKRMFNLLHMNGVVNFEIVLVNNLLNILRRLIRITFEDESSYSTRITNLHNFGNFINIVFRFVYNDLKGREDKLYLDTYMYNLYTNLYKIVNNKLDINYYLYKFFYRNYVNYLIKMEKSGVYNTYSVEIKSKKIYFYKYINIHRRYLKNDINYYLRNDYSYLTAQKHYLHNIKKIKKFKMNCLKNIKKKK